MNCPIDETELRITERQGIEIDYCPKCRGVWLDRGELDKLIERMSPPERIERMSPPERIERDAVGLRDERPLARERAYDRDRPDDRDRDRGYERDRDDDDYRPRKSRRRSLLDEIFDID